MANRGSRRGIPVGVAIVGVLAFLLGLMWLMLGVAAVLAEGDEVMSAAVGAIAVIIGLAFLLFGLGCLKGWSWVWTLGMVLTVLGLVISFFSWFRDELDVSSLMFSVVFQLILLMYLSTSKVKRWFGKD